MEVLLTAGYTLLFYFIIRRNSFFNTGSIPSRFPAYVFILKCLSGILLGVVYTIYYTNHNDTDTFKFYSDSKILFDSLFTNPYDFFRMLTGFDAKAPELREYYVRMDSWLNTNVIYNDNKTIIRFNAFLRFFSLGYYNVHVVFINFISFFGLFCLYKTFIAYVPGKGIELFIVTFLMPSVMFWGSGLLKDGLVLSGLGIFIYAFTRILKEGVSKKRLAAFFIGLVILMFTKIYILVILAPGIVAWWLSRKGNTRNVVLAFALLYGIYFLIAFNLYRIDDYYDITDWLFYKKKNFIEIGFEHSASMIPMPDFQCSALSIFLHAPQAFGNVLLRPFITDHPGNPMILLAAIENLFILLLFLVCILSFNRKNKPFDGLILISIVFIIMLFVLVGLITPVLGAIVRYKIVALPFLMFLLVYYYDREKLLRRFSLLKRFGSRPV